MEILKSARTPDLLDEAKRRLELTSDYQLGKALGWLSGTMSGYRTGRTSMDVPQAAHFCEVTGISIADVARAVVNDREARKLENRQAVGRKAA